MRWWLLLVCGCYAPTVQPGSPCAADGACPTGLVCSPASGTCERTAIDAATHPGGDAPGDATGIDARIVDAFVPDAPPDGPPAPAVLVQQKVAQNTTGAGITVTYETPPSGGDLLVMVGANPQEGLTSVTGAASSWTLLARSTVNANIEIWVGVAMGGAPHATVTVSATGADAPTSVWLGELTHATATADAASTVLAGNASPVAPPPITTASYDLAILGIGDGVGNTFGALDGWTAGTQLTAGPVTQGVWITNVDPGTTLAPMVSETSHAWDAALAVVKRQ